MQATLSKVVSFAQMGLIGIGIGGNFVPAIRDNPLYQQMQQYKSVVLIGGYFVLNMLSSSLSQTNAFEIYLNDQLVFSKLKSGRMPSLEEVVARIPLNWGNKWWDSPKSMGSVWLWFSINDSNYKQLWLTPPTTTPTASLMTDSTTPLDSTALQSPHVRVILRSRTHIGCIRNTRKKDRPFKLIILLIRARLNMMTFYRWLRFNSKIRPIFNRLRNYNSFI